MPLDHVHPPPSRQYTWVARRWSCAADPYGPGSRYAAKFSSRGARFDPRHPSNPHDLDELLNSGEVSRISRVQPRRVSVSGGRNKKVHDPGSGFPTRGHNGGSELAVAGGD